MNTDELIEELEAFDPKYQTRYTTLAAAAEAAGIVDEFMDWLGTPAGLNYSQIVSAHDHTADNAERKAQQGAEQGMLFRNLATDKRGYVVEGDGV